MAVESLGDQWWVEVTHAFSAHVREELGILEAYEHLADTLDDPGICYLLRLILDDEHRHHRLWEEMAEAARTEFGSPDGTPPAPRADAARGTDLLEQTRRFLDIEREDAERLRELRRKLKPVRDDTLWHLLVELMEHDTAKHVRILEYLERRLRRS